MTVSTLRPEFLAKFTCLGAECEDTCCQSWNMQVDAHTLSKYRATGPDLMQAVTGTGGDVSMKRDAKTDFCVKFEGGLCGIQKQYGEDFLSDACHLYPRVTRALGSHLTMTAALSCPEITRLALFEEGAFAASPAQVARVPSPLTDYLPQGLDPEQALLVHTLFIKAAEDERRTPERALMHILTASESLAKVSPGSWPDAAPFYLEHASANLPAAQPQPTDPFFLLQALCGLVAAAKKTRQARLVQTIDDMKKALHVEIPWDTLAIQSMPDCMHAVEQMQSRWQREGKALYSQVLRRYLMAQLSLALFPFAGFGNTLPERVGIIAIRFSTIKLALMSAAMCEPAMLPVPTIVRIIQSISRFLDHLAEPEYSLKIYQETGWLKPARLRALIGDEESS